MIATIGFFLMMLALVLQVVRLLKGGEEKPARKSGLSEAAAFGVFASSLLLLAEIVIRSAAIRFVAVTNIYESLLAFSALVGFLLFGYRRAAREKANPFIVFGGIVACIALLAIASSPVVPKEVLPPVPALQSHWLVLHVTHGVSLRAPPVEDEGEGGVDPRLGAPRLPVKGRRGGEPRRPIGIQLTYEGESA